ncbi:hypothetical protein P5673_007195 [Acropora cervicornis]|uniref:Uncharacterized protein n=1 Tax=Acropora cervicornis TaxID=6130 RepID=A0AAD9VBD6_ACRCE|nr:hypothetical protein P5673_007195 [Acropora cervicornis]
MCCGPGTFEKTQLALSARRTLNLEDKNCGHSSCVEDSKLAVTNDSPDAFISFMRACVSFSCSMRPSVAVAILGKMKVNWLSQGRSLDGARTSTGMDAVKSTGFLTPFLWKYLLNAIVTQDINTSLTVVKVE